MYGFHSNVLLVDVTDRSHRVEEIPETVLRRYLAGRGLGSYLLWQDRAYEGAASLPAMDCPTTLCADRWLGSPHQWVMHARARDRTLDPYRPSVPAGRRGRPNALSE